MSAHSITTFLSLNRNLTSGGGGREFRLPRMNPFPQLNTRLAVRSTVSPGGATILGDCGPLPEMTTDVIDSASGYAVENVKLERGDGRSRSRMGWNFWVGRMWGGQRVVRP